MKNKGANDGNIPICYIQNTNPSPIHSHLYDSFNLTLEGQEANYNISVIVQDNQGVIFGSMVLEAEDGTLIAADSILIENKEKALLDFSRYIFSILDTQEYSILWGDGSEMSLEDFRKVVQTWKLNNNLTNS